MLRYTAALLLLLSNLVCPAGETVEKAPAPEWVVQAGNDFPSTGEGEDGSVRYLLVDVQKHAEEKETYEAFATRILTSAGVEDYSQISVDFQPTFQTLVWHQLDVIRDGERQDRLAAAEFEVIRREEGLDRQLYDGELTAHVILKDIRPGDIVSYSFTIRGENPIFNGHVHALWSTGFSIPVERIRRSVIWNPEARTMAWQLTDPSENAVEEILKGGLRRISIDMANVAKTEAEQNTPNWFRDYPELEISDYGSWEEFGKWTAGIYKADAALPPELAAICEGIRKEGGTPQEQAVKALRWVQGNIRYLGSFFGEHTHAPYPLEEIWGRRFGDCKDKGMLTVAMLRELGFDAAPALVHTSLRAAVADRLPGHSNFNHLIVHLSMDEKDYWLDPTRTFQRGTLDKQYSPDYGLAFVMREGVSELTAALPSGTGEAGIRIHEVFSITDDDGNGTLTVTTTCSGMNADNIRRTFASDSKADLEEEYREYYEDDYPGIEVAAPMTIADDEGANRITSVEHYRLKEFLAKPETPGGSAIGSVYARSISGYLGVPDSKERKHPYGISHPVRYSHTIDLTIPKNWELEADAATISLPAASYSYRLIPTGNRLTLNHEYTSLAGHVEPGDFTKYTKAMKDGTDRLYFEFTYPLGDTAAVTSVSAGADEDDYLKSRLLLGAFVALGLFIGLLISIALYFWDPSSRASTFARPGGIGGWLVLPTIGCFINPITTLYVIVTDFGNIGADGITLFNAAADQAEWRLYYCTSIFVESVQLCICILMLILLLRHRTSFPYVYVGFAVVLLCSLLLNFALQSNVPSALKSDNFAGEISTSVLRIFIWCAYMLISERVKATFVNRRKPEMRRQLPPPLPVHP